MNDDSLSRPRRCPSDRRLPAPRTLAGGGGAGHAAAHRGLRTGAACLLGDRRSEAHWHWPRHRRRAGSAGTPCGPLDGVPLTLKENIATAGTPLPLGSAATELVPAARDAPPAARLREAGAVLLAKTTMPDYGMLSSGLSSFHALARNPWNLALTPGGSSAGAGAAAAAGYGPLHLGTDIGGSIRLPAGWCGVFGLKPSHGRIPIHPPYAGRVAGPMTRSVADAALMMGPLSRPDARDPTSLPWQDIAWSRPRARAARPAHRTLARCRCRPGGRSAGARGGRADRTGLRGRRRSG